MVAMTTESPASRQGSLAAKVRALAAEYEALTEARDAARDRLRDAVVRLVESGEVSEVQAAKLAGISRQGLRQWLGKQDHRNRPMRHGKR